MSYEGESPVQNIVLKMAQNIPLDTEVKHNITMLKSISGDGEPPILVSYSMTEAEYVSYLEQCGRAIRPKGPVRHVVLAAGRVCGKTYLLGLLATQVLESRISHTGKHSVAMVSAYPNSFLMNTITEIVCSASLELSDRFANNMVNCKRFQTDEDIALTGPWEGSQRRARASLALHALTPNLNQVHGSPHMLVGVDEISYAKDPFYFYTKLKACYPSSPIVVVGTPTGRAGEWLADAFANPKEDTLYLRIPTWEMRDWLMDGGWYESIFPYLRGIPIKTFLTEYGASFTHKSSVDTSIFADEKLLKSMLSPPEQEPRVGTALNEIGARHREWQDKNFDNCTSLTQALALAEECGEVCRAVLKTHHGIRESDRGQVGEELADVILVATALAHRLGIDIDLEVSKKAAKRDLKNFRARPDSG